MPLGLDNNLKIFYQSDNFTEKTATDINQAMVIVTILYGKYVRMFIVTIFMVTM